MPPLRLALDLPAGCAAVAVSSGGAAGAQSRAAMARSTTLRWTRWGASARPIAATGGLVELEFDGPGMLVILPRAHLSAAAGRRSGGFSLVSPRGCGFAMT